MTRLLLLIGCLLLAPMGAAQEPCDGLHASPAWSQGLLNDTARVLAGLAASDDSTLASQVPPAALTRHRETMTQAFARLRERQLAAVSEFAQRELAALPAAPRVYYPFSGPDALYLLSFFPTASNSLLTGLEPVGQVPVVYGLEVPELEASLAELRNSLEEILAFSFFRTNDMQVDLRRSRFRGVTPILFAFVAEAGYAIVDVRYLLWPPGGPVCVASAEAMSAPPRGHLPAIQIDYFKPGEADFRRLTYVQADIGDQGLRSTPQYLDQVRDFGPQVTYLKSASYLMHKSYFSTIRSLILSESGTVLQEDSGVPHRFFDPRLWTVQLYGRYAGPIALFAEWRQDDLARAYREAEAGPLDFGIGYRHRRSESGLQLYRRRST